MAAPALTRPFRKRNEELERYINLKLAAMGQPVGRNCAGLDFLEIARPHAISPARCPAAGNPRFPNRLPMCC